MSKVEREMCEVEREICGKVEREIEREICEKGRKRRCEKGG